MKVTARHWEGVLCSRPNMSDHGDDSIPNLFFNLLLPTVVGCYVTNKSGTKQENKVENKMTLKSGSDIQCPRGRDNLNSRNITCSFKK